MPRAESYGNSSAGPVSLDFIKIIWDDGTEQHFAAVSVYKQTPVMPELGLHQGGDWEVVTVIEKPGPKAKTTLEIVEDVVEKPAEKSTT